MNASMDVIDEEQGHIQRNDDIRHKEILVVDIPEHASQVGRSSKTKIRRTMGKESSAY